MTARYHVIVQEHFCLAFNGSKFASIINTNRYICLCASEKPRHCENNVDSVLQHHYGRIVAIHDFKNSAQKFNQWCVTMNQIAIWLCPSNFYVFPPTCIVYSMKNAIGLKLVWNCNYVWESRLHLLWAQSSRRWFDLGAATGGLSLFECVLFINKFHIAKISATACFGEFLNTKSSCRSIL